MKPQPPSDRRFNEWIVKLALGLLVVLTVTAVVLAALRALGS